MNERKNWVVLRVNDDGEPVSCGAPVSLAWNGFEFLRDAALRAEQLEEMTPGLSYMVFPVEDVESVGV